MLAISRVSGTPQWMAPEMMVPGGTYSSKLDVFSFGVVLWEMLSGMLPYHKVCTRCTVGPAHPHS